MPRSQRLVAPHSVAEPRVAFDRVADMLHRRGIHDALINIGGNVLALGSKSGVLWTVGLQHPRKPVPMATIELKDGEAIGTSGDYQRFFEKDGKRYSHLIDPRNGQPASSVQAVTVIAVGSGAGTLSDVATKSLFVGGKGLRLRMRSVSSKDVLLVEADGTVRATRSLLARIVWLEKAGPSVAAGMIVAGLGRKANRPYHCSNWIQLTELSW